jgi:hypothetical protein
MPFTDQVTEVSPVIVAVNCVEFPGVTAAPIGVTETCTATGGGGGGGVVDFDPEDPQPLTKYETAKQTTAVMNVFLIRMLPTPKVCC